MKRIGDSPIWSPDGHLWRPGMSLLNDAGEIEDFGQFLRRLMAAPSQYLQPLLLQAIFGGGASQAQWTGVATVYLGLSTQTWSTSVTDASLKSGEPTSTGSYARVSVTNNTTNFPAATGSNPATSKLHIAQTFATSTAAWSTGTTALASVFIADASTLGGGNVLWSGALSPATDTVNGTGITFSFAADALQMTLQ